MRVSIKGHGQSRLARQPEKRLEDLAAEAVTEALGRAGVDPLDVGAVFVGSVLAPAGAAMRVARATGLAHGPVLSLEAACASGTVAAHQAIAAVARGEHRYTVAVGVEQLSTLFTGPIRPEGTDAEGAIGLPLPGLYALQAQRYRHLYGVDLDDLALVAVKNRANGADNPRAFQRSRTTVEEVLSSRLIADPLTFYQCCPMPDGAAAIVLGPQEGGDDVTVAASAVVGGHAWPDPSRDETWSSACVRRAARRAEQELGEPLSSGSFFEVHDAFTIGEVLTVEALGLFEPGTTLDALRDHRLDRDGDTPVNPSGGLISRGHPLGATGLLQVVESVRQLSGEAGAIQLADPRRAVIETMGGGASGLDGNCAAILVLDRV